MTSKKKISESASIHAERDVLENSGNQYFQIDILKTVMIFLVIFDHVVSWDVKKYIGVALWERISIPVFLVIMGFNMGNSFKRRENHTLKQLYSKEYFKRKVVRYLVPFLILYGFSTLFGFIWYRFDISAMYQQQYGPSHGVINLFIGILPFWGPGNWFIPVILQSILIIPLLYRGFKKKPVLTLILCFIIEIVMQLTVFFFIGNLYPRGVISWPKVHILNIFMSSIFFYLSAIGLGMWFSLDHNLKSNRNIFMWFLYPVSLAYMIAYQFFGFQFMIGDVPLIRGDYHLLVFPYSAFLFLLALRYLPQKSSNKFSRAISYIGRSTYHILLIQIFGYGMVYAVFGTHYAIESNFVPIDILNLIIFWIIFIPFGIWWYKIDRDKILWRRALNTVILFVSFILLIVLILWLGSLS
jgi:hypothetical protein